MMVQLKNKIILTIALAEVGPPDTIEPCRTVVCAHSGLSHSVPNQQHVEVRAATNTTIHL